MQSHEYRVVPAPRRGLKAKGVRTPEDRFARAVEGEMNRMAREGWEFVRSDTLPSEHKPGWFSKPVTVFQTMLVFRRPVAGKEAAPAEAAMPPPLAHAPLPSPVPAPKPVPAPTLMPPVAAPAASRFTPPPAPQPAADDPVHEVPPPALTLVELPEPQDQPPGPRHAAE